MTVREVKLRKAAATESPASSLSLCRKEASLFDSANWSDEHGVGFQGGPWPINVVKPIVSTRR